MSKLLRYIDDGINYFLVHNPYFYQKVGISFFCLCILAGVFYYTLCEK